MEVKLTVRPTSADRTLVVSISPSGEVELLVNNIPADSIPDLLDDLSSILKANASQARPTGFNPQPMSGGK